MAHIEGSVTIRMYWKSLAGLSRLCGELLYAHQSDKTGKCFAQEMWQATFRNEWVDIELPLGVEVITKRKEAP